jgi:LysR family transcriptional regulator, glycine cleavage system transcriptional activator
MSRPPLHALQGFIATARAGNLSRAAEALHLTVSALSHQIRGLEDRLGYRLFVRNARGVELTTDGRQLFERIAPPFQAIELALRPYCPRRDDVLTLSLTPSMASAWLVPRLSGFLAAHPQIEISLQSSATLVDFQRDTNIDAALRIGQGQWPGVTSEHLFDEWVTPVASPELAARHGPFRMEDLARWPLLGDPDRDDLWNVWFARFGGSPPARYTAYFDDSEALHRGAAAGVGVALGKLTRIRLLLESGQLVRLTPEQLQTDYGHYLVYPERSRDHAGLRAFREWLLVQAQEYGDSYAKVSQAATVEPAPRGKAPA